MSEESSLPEVVRSSSGIDGCLSVLKVAIRNVTHGDTAYTYVCVCVCVLRDSRSSIRPPNALSRGRNVSLIVDGKSERIGKSIVKFFKKLFYLLSLIRIPALKCDSKDIFYIY